jgi:hypothetical protein
VILRLITYIGFWTEVLDQGITPERKVLRLNV